MNENFLEKFGKNSIERVEKAASFLKNGCGVLLVDNPDRENEGDLIFSAEKMTDKDMALMIRECSGIACLCLTEDKAKILDLNLMVPDNTSKFHTNFTVSIEAAKNVTTGISAKERIITIKTAISDSAIPSDLNRPGHVFPLISRKNGVFEREGHTEGSVDLMKIAGLKPYAVLCELVNEDGTVAKMPEIFSFTLKHNMTIVSIEDIINYRKTKEINNSIS